MNDEEAKLVTQTIFGGLMYGIKVHYECEVYDDYPDDYLNDYLVDTHHINGDDIITSYDAFYKCFICGGYKIHATHIKPYLRQFSEMTEDEAKECYAILDGDGVIYDDILTLFGHTNDAETVDIQVTKLSQFIQWCYSKHFDVNGLIPKGLALKAKQGMYN